MAMKKYVLLLCLMLSIIPLWAQDNAEIVDTPVPLRVIIDDFEDGVPFAVDEFGNGLGLVPWGDVPENLLLSATRLIAYSKYALPGRENAPNVVLGVNYDIQGWGGFTHAFSKDGKAWTSMDWSRYNALSLWVYGT